MADKTPTTPSPNEPSALLQAPVAQSLPPLERYSSHYIRYNGPIGKKGANQTTHTAEVRFPGCPGLAVVKAFAFRDKGWVNEALAWTLGVELDVGVPPVAMLLAASAADLASAHAPELQIARSQFGSTGPIMLWCASRLEIKPPQHVWPISWERIVMSKPFGRRLAAFDAWLGNCDRIAQNAPYWTTKGRLAAIDHERIAFNQDWICGKPIHMDRSGGVMTHLMKALREAIGKKKLKTTEASALISELVQLSNTHAEAFSEIWKYTQELVTENFGVAAAENLRNFLEQRASSEFIDERLEQLR